MISPRMDIAKNLLCLALVMVAAFFTYVSGYEDPPNLFWDENYHIAHAQKYLNGVFFMEPHPPLGKLLIALGEKLIDANADDSIFIGTDHASSAPAGFSFAGYRFFPVILAWLSSALVYLIALTLFESRVFAVALSAFYVFDNALVVHQRSAMLESVQIFFMLASLAAFFMITSARLQRSRLWIWSMLFGLAFAAAVATKLTAVVLFVLIPIVCARLWHKRGLLKIFIPCSAVSFAVVYILVWQIHFSLGATTNPALSNKGYYQASQNYLEIIEDKQTSRLMHLPLMLADSFRFVAHYQKGVPLLNLCKPGENGSPWFLWPIGARAINYRWEDAGDGNRRYLYLQSNPAVWLCSLAGVAGAFVIVFGHALFGLARPPKRQFAIKTVLLMWVGYMGGMAVLNRVMYLYHYLIPMIFGLILFALVIDEITKTGKIRLAAGSRQLILAGLAGIAVLSFYYFSPLTYYKPISNDQLKSRAWIGLWDLRCAECSLSNSIAFPLPNQSPPVSNDVK